MSFASCDCVVLVFREQHSDVFPGLTAATIIFGFARNLVLFSVLVRCAQSLHDHMFSAILQTPVRFFDVNPIGEQRFLKVECCVYWEHSQ